MCGIAGALGPSDAGLVQSMLCALGHRGPDGSGAWRNGSTQLGVARLAIIDPDAPATPLANEGGTIRLAFNGEIYNHRELRAELLGRGHVFATHTDSEVVLHLYEELGAACVHRLRGMFAFAIADGDGLLLARDRLGIKPLYYRFDPREGLFVFASEIKALLQPGFDARLDMQAFADRVVLGHATSTRTYLEGVHSLAPGHTLTARQESGTLRLQDPRRYFDRRPVRRDGMSYEEAELALEEVLEEALDRHLAADVEVGVALSGGLDSALLALLAEDHGQLPLRTFAVADYARNPDVVTAADVAAAIGADHTTSIVGFEEWLDAVPRYVAAEEQPSTLLGMPFYLLSERVAASVKACICGEGADELFGGYAEYLHRGAKVASLTRRRPVLERLGVGLSDEAAEIVACLTSARTYSEYLEAVFEINVGDPLERLHLEGVDKNAMAHGLEMRVPYLDDRVYALVTSMPARFLVHGELGIRKYVLRRFCLRRFGMRFVDVVLREKVAVPSSGVRHLLRFDRLCEEVLPASYLESHELGFCFGTKRELLTFEIFHDVFLRGGGDVGVVGNVLDYLDDRAVAEVTRGAA